jgi:hypothetical protein
MMMNQFFDPIPQRGCNPYSELEMQALFTKFLPIVPLPADFAIQLKERVLAEVAIVIKPDKTRMILSAGWVRALAQKSSLWLFARLWLLALITGITLWLVTAFLTTLFELSSDD